MRDILKDEKLKKLLSEKHRLEMYSWVIPLISIISLIIILYLTSQKLTGYTIIVLVILIILIILAYIFDNRITIKIHKSYTRLTDYFHGKIVPLLLKADNPTITFQADYMMDPNLIDQVQVFNNYTSYRTYFHYDGEIEGYPFSFNEAVFSHLVEYDTTGQKELNSNIKKNINYHWYTIDLKREYPVEALYQVSQFEHYDNRLIKSFYRFDFYNCRTSLNPDLEIELFIKDLSESRQYIAEKILKTLNHDLIVYGQALIIFISKNKLHVIIEEVNDLIDLTHSNKIVVENLMAGYFEEQKILKMLVKAFE